MRYHANAITTAEVLQELIQLAKDIHAARQRGEESGLSDEEIAFYDAPAENESAVQAMGDDKLKVIAHELLVSLKSNVWWTGHIAIPRAPGCACWSSVSCASMAIRLICRTRRCRRCCSKPRRSLLDGFRVTDDRSSADRPSIDPKDDLLAMHRLPRAWRTAFAAIPVVMAWCLPFYGPWGSGKSTVLMHVGHYIEQQPKEDRPVVAVQPFGGSLTRKLARAFLDNFCRSAQIRVTSSRGWDLLGDFAEGVGGLIDLSGVTGGAVGKLPESSSEC